ncbi:hypothetical protein AK812_SmicGene35043 [Symbiodinium microadriaticum]|uniref:Uncharacterized protein n=1 Tax=Symbiodinium microadriaticum TaxID=2951 RepID=A0A1Q9CMF6_SYMMI|nr:hypothetical protein AK812_SmicGene35043 [Symbiodinium microadriaticum]
MIGDVMRHSAWYFCYIPPGIPLSLKAPSFERARFTMEAGTIIVDFDRATLQGALTVAVMPDVERKRKVDELA